MNVERRSGPKASSANKEKRTGRVYTPPAVVKTLLDHAGYVGNVVGRHIVDNSCGDGAFLEQVARRYVAAFRARSGHDNAELAQDLRRYIHGVDLDPDALVACNNRLHAVAVDLGIDGVAWDLHQANTLRLTDFRQSMDFVVGNPPYVRVHNLGSSAIDVRTLTFSADGMTDLYLAFFDVGIQMLAPEGRLCFITPSSWLTSKAGGAFRTHLARNGTLTSVVDFGHHQAFDATTYSLIARIDGHSQGPEVAYHEYDPRQAAAVYQYNVRFAEAHMPSGIFFGQSAELADFRRIVSSESDGQPAVVVRNGFATLADGVFIGDFAFADGIIPVVKASTGQVRQCVFPYQPDGTPLTESEFERTAPLAMAHLRQHRTALTERSLDARTAWHQFGRSQALRDVGQAKFAINSLLQTTDQIRIVAAPPAHGVYGGLYFRGGPGPQEVRRVLATQEFMSYIKMLRKYKSGGYYTFSAEDLSRFLTHAFAVDSVRQQGQRRRVGAAG